MTLSVNQSVDDGGVCRTVLATPGLLKIIDNRNKLNCKEVHVTDLYIFF